MRRLPACVGVLLVLVACSGGGSSTSGAAGSTTTTVAASASTTRPPETTPATTSTSTPGPTTTLPKTIKVANITFHTPSSWDSTGAVPTFYVGILAGGKGDVTLRVQTGFAGTIDSLKPTTCLGAPPSTPASVDLADTGFKVVGDRTAEYRFWKSSCPNGDVKVEEHRAWLLPTSQIAIFEQRHEAQVEDVVATAHVG